MLTSTIYWEIAKIERGQIENLVQTLDDGRIVPLGREVDYDRDAKDPIAVSFNFTAIVNKFMETLGKAERTWQKCTFLSSETFLNENFPQTFLHHCPKMEFGQYSYRPSLQLASDLPTVINFTRSFLGEWASLHRHPFICMVENI